MISAASALRVRTSHLPRRATSSTSRPTTSRANVSGAGWRMARGQSVRNAVKARPVTRGASSRAIVSTSGSSGTLAGSGTEDGRDRLPVVAALEIDVERHVEAQHGLHDITHDRRERVELVARHLHEDLVVDGE